MGCTEFQNVTLRVGAVLLLAGLILSCDDDSSPTAPEPPPAVQAIIVFADSGALSEYHPRITELINQTFDAARGAIPLGMVRFTVSNDLSRVIPGWGIGGYAPSAMDIDIVVDPNFPGLDQVLTQRLPGIVAHELHHAARWAGPGYGSTLLEAMVSEGLADHFALDLVGGAQPPWTDAFPESDTNLYLARAQPLFDSTAYDFAAWFFGRGDLPRWTGYTLGYRLVDEYLAANPGQSAASLVGASAELFRP